MGDGLDGLHWPDWLENPCKTIEFGSYPTGGQVVYGVQVRLCQRRLTSCIRQWAVVRRLARMPDLTTIEHCALRLQPRAARPGQGEIRSGERVLLRAERACRVIWRWPRLEQ
jgi:hypothetical protein